MVEDDGAICRPKVEAVKIFGYAVFAKSKLLAAIKNHVPLGYQDKTGFHFGVQQPHKDQCPSFW